MVFGIVVVWALGLDERGVDIVGHIDSGLSSLGLPEVAAADYLALAPSAIGVMLVGFAEGLGAAKTYAAQEHYEIDANRELLGLGAANLGAGLSSGMVVNGSLSKTAVNGSAGARSQVSGLVVAALTVLTLLFLTGLFETLPEATLAAVVIAAVIELIDIPALVAPLAGRHPPAPRHLRRRRPARLPGRAGRAAGRAGLRHPPRAVHRHRGVAAAAALPGLAPARGRARPGPRGRRPLRRHPPPP